MIRTNSRILLPLSRSGAHVSSYFRHRAAPVRASAEALSPNPPNAHRGIAPSPLTPPATKEPRNLKRHTRPKYRHTTHQVFWGVVGSPSRCPPTTPLTTPPRILLTDLTQLRLSGAEAGNARDGSPEPAWRCLRLGTRGGVYTLHFAQARILRLY